MILSTHALTGAVIGKNITNLWLIILLSLVFHFLMDTLRHGEYFDDRTASLKNTWWKVVLDLFIGFFLVFSVFLIQDWNEKILINVFVGMFFSMFPDGLSLLFYLGFKNKLLSKIKYFHSLCHFYSHYPKYSLERRWTFRNVLNDLLISFLAIILLFL